MKSPDRTLFTIKLLRMSIKKIQTLVSLFSNSVGDSYFPVSISVRRGRRRDQPLLNTLFCLYLVIDEHGHLKIYLPKKLLECLPKCTSLPKERHRWNTNEVLLYRTGSRSFASVREKTFLLSALFWLPGFQYVALMFTLFDPMISIIKFILFTFFYIVCFYLLPKKIERFFLKPSLNMVVFFSSELNHVFRTLITLGFFPLCKYWHKRQKCTSLSQTETLISP